MPQFFSGVSRFKFCSQRDLIQESGLFLFTLVSMHLMNVENLLRADAPFKAINSRINLVSDAYCENVSRNEVLINGFCKL